MMNITLGQYFPGDSPIHRLDPRTKLLGTIAIITAIFLCSGFVGYAIVFLFLLGVIKLSQVNYKVLLKGIKSLRFIIIFTCVINIFFQTEGAKLFAFGPISVTWLGIQLSIFMALRLILLVIGTQLLTLTTSPIALTDGLESLFKPMSKIGFPAHELAMMMSIALRFIPTLLEEADRIMKAQKARGADFESGNLIARAKAMIPLLVPLFVSAFRRADDLALAMEARCYRGGEHRTRMKELHYEKIDLYAGLIMLALIVIIALLPV